MICPVVLRGLNMNSLLLLVLLVPPPSPGQAAELGWMKVDGYGNPSPADHQVRSSSRQRSVI